MASKGGDLDQLHNATKIGLRTQLKHPLLVNIGFENETELNDLYDNVQISTDLYERVDNWSGCFLEFGADSSGQLQSDDLFYGMTEAELCDINPPFAFRPYIKCRDTGLNLQQCKAVGVMEALTNENQTVFTVCHTGTYHTKFKLPAFTSIEKESFAPQTGFEKYLGQEAAHLRQPSSFSGLSRGFKGSI